MQIVSGIFTRLQIKLQPILTPLFSRTKLDNLIYISSLKALSDAKVSGVCQIYFLNDLLLQQPGSLAVENEVRRQSSLVTDNESLWLSSCYQDGPDEVLTVNYL